MSSLDRPNLSKNEVEVDLKSDIMEIQDHLSDSTVVNIYIPKERNIANTISSFVDHVIIHEDIDIKERMELQEDICDASTVVNVSIQNKGRKVAKKGLTFKEVEHDMKENWLESTCMVHKVATWLQRVQFENSEEKLYLKDLDWWTTNSQLNQIDSVDLNSFSAIHLHVFLISVHPNPAVESLDLVSGWCQSGCQGYTVFSKIHWLNNRIPICPKCLQAENQKELLLMFVVKLRVMDQKGRFSVLNLFRDQAEYFFKCCPQEYVQNKVIRDKIVDRLQDIIVNKTKSFVPLMEVCVVLNKSYYFVLNTRLKMPSTDHNEKA